MSQSSACNDLMFTHQPDLIVNSAVHLSLYSNCYHQITYCKFNLNIKHPPPYKRSVWDYNIKKYIGSVNLELMFSNQSVHKRVSIFIEIIMNIFSNFTPNKPVTLDERDPPGMNHFVESKIK